MRTVKKLFTISEETERNIKSEAALRGITLKQYVQEIFDNRNKD